MKKLMIAATIVCVAALAQAANINWSTAAKFAPNQDGSKAMVGEQTVYIMQTDIAGDKGYSAFLTALGEAGFNSSAISSWDCYAGSLQTVTWSQSKNAGKGNGTATATAVDGGAGEFESHDYAAILFQKDAEGKEYYLLSSATAIGKAKDPNDPLDASVDAQFSASSFSSSTWTPLQAAPEPTSGLLLLLGVAGLALRRKQK